MVRSKRWMLVWLLLGVPATSFAQDRPTPRTTFWGFAALGAGATDTDSSFYAAGIGAALQRGRLVLMARIASVGPEDTNRLEDFGALVGLGTRPGRWHAMVAAGVGGVRQSDNGTAAALPVEAQLTWRFTRVVGIGLRGFLSFNRFTDFGGLTVAAQIGRLW